MVKSYCVKQREKTECVPGSERIVETRNGRLMMKCKCAECGITKTSFVKSSSIGRSSGGGRSRSGGRSSGARGGSLDPLGTVLKGINVGKEISKTLFPQTKKMFKDYESGKIAKEVVNKRDGIQTKRFWKPSKKTIIADRFLKGQCTRAFPTKDGRWLNVDCD